MRNPFDIPRRGSDVGQQIAAIRNGETESDKYADWSLKQLREEMADAVERAKVLAKKGDSGEKLTPDEEAEWDNLLDEKSGVLTQMGKALRQKEDEALVRRTKAAQTLFAEHTPQEANPKLGEFSMQSKTNRPRVDVSYPELKAFKNDESGRRQAYESAMWLQAVIGRSKGIADEHAENVVANAGWDIRATATEGTDTAGGYLVPSPLESAFIDFRSRSSVVRPIARYVAMSSQTTDVPKLTSGPSVTYPGEATAATPSDQVWANVRLSATKRMVLSKVSNELQSDAVINYIDRLVTRAAYEIALQEDQEAINGDGTATYGNEMGLLSSLGTGGIVDQATGNTWDAIVLSDFTSAMSLLPAQHNRGGTSWLCSSAFYYDVMVRVLAAAGGNTMVVLETGAADQMPSFLGRPVHLTPAMPQTTAVDQVSCLYGKFDDAIILGDRQAVSIGISADRYFDEDVTAVRLTERIDWNVHESGDASDAGAYVGLSTGS